MALAEDRFWVIDVEGNGASPPEIIELAMVEVGNLSITGNQRRWLVRPEQPITPIVSRIHGLTNADVSDAPSINDLKDDILSCIQGTPIVGHNVHVEVDILMRSLSGWVPSVAIDTLRLSRALCPGLKSYSLGKLGIFFGFEQEAANRSGASHHAALFDATLTALIFIKLLRDLSEVNRKAALRDADILYRKQDSFL